MKRQKNVCGEVVKVKTGGKAEEGDAVCNHTSEQKDVRKFVVF